MKVCGTPGCVELTKTAFCTAHTAARPHGWATSQHTNPKGWDVIRKRILRRDGYKCAVCGNPADFVDHLLPMAWGGHSTAARNLRAMCGECHQRKTNDEKRVGKVLAKMSPGDRAAAIQRFLARWRS